MAVDGRARRLDDEDIGAAHVFLNLQVDLAVGELPQRGLAQREAETSAQFLGERRISAACEDFEAVRIHRAYRPPGGPFSSIPCSFSLPRPFPRLRGTPITADRK